MGLHQNFIAGEWVKGDKVTKNINPSDTNDVIGEFVQATAADTEAAIAAAHAAAPAWSRTTPQERHDILKRVGDEVIARKDELGKLLAREEGKTLPEGVGETVRAGQIFLFFAQECLRMAGELVPSVRPGVDRRDHARGRRRRRHHHAVEFPHRDSGVEDRARARLRQHRGVQAGRPRAGLRACAGRDHRESRNAEGRVQPDHGPRLGGRRDAFSIPSSSTP